MKKVTVLIQTGMILNQDPASISKEIG